MVPPAGGLNGNPDETGAAPATVGGYPNADKATGWVTFGWVTFWEGGARR
jgi:hypothetical protein